MNIKALTTGLLVPVRTFFSKGHQRTLLAKKNIAFSFLLKSGSIAIGLILIPLTIKYINTAQYGIWLTLSSIVSWITFFDIGLGNGLKNTLAKSNALGQSHNSRVLVSTTYAILLIIAASLLLIFMVLNQYINWSSILNTGHSAYNFNHIALLVFALFCIQFVAQIINAILTACHKVANVSLILLIGQVTTLIAVFLLVKFTQSSLFLLIPVNGSVPVVILILASLWYFKHDLKDFSPSIKLVKFEYTRELLSLGGVFFIIQLGALVLFQTDNIVIVQVFGPSHVTTFNIAYKLFSVFLLGFDIIMAPFWSAFTDAYARNDFQWIKAVMIKMRYLWILITLGAVILFFISGFIYKIWLNNTITVPKSLSLAMAIYIAAYTWQTIHVYFLNGINKIRLQLYLVIISAIINIPLAIFLGKRIGLAGITLSNAILFLIMGAIFFYQTTKILNKTATGILNA
jgi:O-antigen/teichoic acid export membrane protein